MPSLVVIVLMVFSVSLRNGSVGCMAANQPLPRRQRIPKQASVVGSPLGAHGSDPAAARARAVRCRVLWYACAPPFCDAIWRCPAASGPMAQRPADERVVGALPVVLLSTLGRGPPHVSGPHCTFRLRVAARRCASCRCAFLAGHPFVAGLQARGRALVRLGGEAGRLAAMVQMVQ